MDDFRELERHGETVWLHKTAPIWVVCYPGIPESMTHRFDSWQAYQAIEQVRNPDAPWAVNNRRLGPLIGWATQEQAFRAARDAAAGVLAV